MLLDLRKMQSCTLLFLVSLLGVPTISQAQSTAQAIQQGAAQAQSQTQTGNASSVPEPKNAGSVQQGTPASTGSDAGKQGEQGGDSKSASGSAAKEYASGKKTSLGPLDPSPAPPKTSGRPRIGLAMGGGGALALSEVGVLQWFEEHHIPVDVIAGTSMGCMVSALYSTGRTPDQLKDVMNDKVFASVFSFAQTYTSKSFRRREDSRDLPNGVTIGLRHGVSFRNAVLTDQGLNSFLRPAVPALRRSDRLQHVTNPAPLCLHRSQRCAPGHLRTGIDPGCGSCIRLAARRLRTLRDERA